MRTELNISFTRRLVIASCLSFGFGVCCIVPGYVALLALCAGAACLSLWDGVLLALEPERLTLSAVFYSGLTLGYAGGTFFSLQARYGMLAEGVNSFFGFPLSTIATSMLLVMILNLELRWMQIFERPFFQRSDYSFRCDSRATRVVLACFALNIAGYATGDLNFMGVQADFASDRTTVLGILAYSVALILPAYLVILRNNETRKHARRMLDVAILLAIALQWPTSRRNVIYSLCIAAIAFGFNQRWRRLPPFKAVGLGLAATLLAVFSFYSFLALRLASFQYKFDPTERVALATLIKDGYGILNNPISRAQLVTDANESTGDRTFILSYVCELVEALKDHAPLYGTDIISSVKGAIPSVLWPGKHDQPILLEEDVSSEAFGLPDIDEANSVLSESLIDWGYWGVVAVPLLIVLIMPPLIVWGGRFLPPNVRFFLKMGAVGVYLPAENLSITYFIFFRDLLPALLILLLVSKLSFGFTRSWNVRPQNFLPSAANAQSPASSQRP